MSASPLTCPYCNALVAESTAASGPRLTCPRCGEPFANRGYSASITASPTEETAGHNPAAPAPSTNPNVAGYLLAFMALAALAGLMFMLATKGFRERVSSSRSKGTGNGSQQHYAPLDLPGLGFLPHDTNLVAGLHVADLTRDTRTELVLERLQNGPLKVPLERLKEWTGLEVEAIDHVVLALSGDVADLRDEVQVALPQLTIVVQTRRPYRQEAIAQAVHPAKALKYHQRPLYHLPVKPLGQAYLWCVEEQTLVLVVRIDGLKKQDLEAIPPAPRKGALPEPLQRLLEHRIPRDARLWLAGDLDDTHPLPAALGLLGFTEAAASAATVDAFALAATVDDPVTLLGSIRCRTVADARRLQLRLQRQAGGKLASLRIIGPASPLLAAGASGTALLPLALPGSAASAAALPLLATQTHFQAIGDPADNWIVLQWRGTGDQLAQLLP